MVHSRPLVRLARVVPLLVSLGPLAARGEPLDVSDLTPRVVVVEVPGTDFAVTAHYGPRVVGGVGSTVEGELEIDADDYESYLAGPGPSPGGDPVPGSFSPAIVTVDLVSLAVDADPITGLVDIGVGPFADLTRTLGTGRLAGHQDVEIAPGFVVTIFCDGPTAFGPCTIVPGSPYDPQTGELTMVGDDTLDHPDITDPRFAKRFVSNELRLSEGSSTAPALGPAGLLGLAIGLAAAGGWAATKPGASAARPLR